MTDMARLPKAELHCHIEGSAPPALVRRIAERNGIALAPALFTTDDRFAWHDFHSFLAAYDAASNCLRSARDYRDLTYEYLMSCAGEGAIYGEFFSSPDHAAECGISYADHLAGMVTAIDDARRDGGITARIIVTCLRHKGPESALAVVRSMLAEPHPYVTGFGMAGDELQFEPADFAAAFHLAADAGYGCTVHAGEFAGPESVKAALACLPVTRLGHGVRASEDPRLMDEIARRGIVLEVCPGSNLALGLYSSPALHPLARLIEAGCRVTLNSDDPPFFATSIGHEYSQAGNMLGLGLAQLLDCTRTAIGAAFVDSATRIALQARIAAPAAHDSNRRSA